jgi:hypothetical protein
MPEGLLIISLLSAFAGVVCLQKGKNVFGWLGIAGLIPALAPFLAPIAVVGALRIAKPNSAWAVRRYMPEEMQIARDRFPEVAASIEETVPAGEETAPVETISPPPSPKPSLSEQFADTTIRNFLYDAWARGLIDEGTHQRLLDHLNGEPAAAESTLAQQETISEDRATQPIPKTPPAPAEWKDTLTPPKTPVTSRHEETTWVERPLEPAASTPPPPPAPPKPSPLAVTMSRVWDAIASDVALHGFSYLGVLLTFVGVLGFLLFAFADIPDAAQPFVELFIAMIFFAWAWVLRRQDAQHVADGMELIGGMVLPLILFAGLVDNAPIPPDFQEGALVAALTVTSVLLAVGYAWFSAAHPDSILRYLVTPLLWLGALALGFAFKTDEVLASTAITRLVPEQPALASAAIAGTLIVARNHLDHRLGTPTVRSSMVGLPVAYLLTIALSIGDDWTVTWPIVLLGAATYLSVELLIGIYDQQSWGVWLRPLLLAGVLGPMGPVIGFGWLGPVVVLGYVLLFEQNRRSLPSRLEPVLLPAVGILTGAVMSLFEPWAALITFTGLTAWAHYRRHITEDDSQVELVFTAAAAVLPVGIGYALTVILGDAVAWMVMAVILATATAVVRWRRSPDVFWPYWLNGAAVVVAAGSLFVWAGGGRIEGWGPTTMGTVALVVGLGPRRPISRLWAGAGLASATIAMALEEAQIPFDQRVVVWSAIGLGAIVIAGVIRRRPVAHVAAIGHIVATTTMASGVSGAAWAVVLAAWSLGWLLSVVAQETDGDSVADLLARAWAALSLGGQGRFAEVSRWVSPVLMVSGIPFALISAANLWERFAPNRSWTGALLATIAVAYALCARLLVGRRPLRATLATAAVISSVIGVAVTAPDPWPTIYATAAVIAVASLLTDEFRRTWFVWFAWLMSVVTLVLLAERAGVPTGSLHLVGLVYGMVMLIGGLFFDDITAGRRSPGEGLRTAWLRHPVLLGALLIPIGAGPLFTDPPGVYGWWALGLGGAYLVAAWLLRAGAVTTAGFALLALAASALSPRSPLEYPPLFMFIAAPLVGIGWAARRAQSRKLGSDWWLRWDIGPLIVAHLVGGLALLMAIGTDSMMLTALVFGLLSIVIGLWRDHRVWIDAGNLLLLLAGFEAGAGWLALAFGATSLRGILGAWLTTGARRVSYQMMGVGAAPLAWWALLDWLDLSNLEAVNWTGPVFASVGVLVALLSRRELAYHDTVVGWGGLGVAGTVVAALAAVSRGGPGVDGPWLAAGFLLTAIAAELAAGKIHAALKLASVVSVGVAWILVAAGLGWSEVEIINYSSLAFAGLALGTAVVARIITVRREDLGRWGGLGATGVLAASAAVLGPAGEAALEQPWVAVGLAVLSVSLQLAAKWFGPMLANAAAATTALSWLALIPATGWTVVETIDYTGLTFASVALAVGLIARIWRAARADIARWGGLGIAGVVVSGLATQTVAGRPALEQPWIALALAVVAVSAELAWRSFDPALRNLTVIGAGLSWLTLLPSTGWTVPVGVAATALAFGTLVVVVVEWSRRFLRARSAATLDVARAWAALGALFVLGAAAVAETSGGWPDASFWVAGCLGLLAVATARAAAPLRGAGLREISSVAGFAALTRLALAAEWPDALSAAGFVVLAATATSAALALWRRSPQSVWIRPIFVLSGLANLVALVQALGTLPERGLLVAVVLTLGAQAIAIGMIRGFAGLLAAGPPLVGLGFIVAIAGNVSGTAQWYTIPTAVVLLSEVETLRWHRGGDDEAVARQDILVLEWASLGLLASPPLVEMFTRGLAHGWSAVGIAIGVMVWGTVTRVRRRFVAAASLAITTSVLMIVAATTARAPSSAFFWILAAGVGFALMMVVAFVEAYRSRKGQVMARLGQLMEGWE